MRNHVLAGALVALGLAAGCGDDDAQPTGGAGPGGAGAQGGQGALGGAGAEGGAGAGGAGGAGAAGGGGGGDGPWESCSLVTEGNDGSAECATFELPAFRDDPSVGTVHVFVKRIAATAPRRGSLWLLSGGPGGSGVGWEGLVSALQLFAPDLDIMIPDHRGTGRSDRLSCPDEEASDSDGGPALTIPELTACASHLTSEWGDKLASFNNTQAAYDVGELVELTREPGDEVHIYGGSYGTQWGHRYLQLFPDQAAGVTLEANCIPQCYFSEIDEWFDALGETFLDACASDALCGAKLGPDPWAALGDLYDNLPSCAGVDPRLDGASLKLFFARTLYGAVDRTLIPAVAYRVNRCSAADVNALNHLAAFLFAPFPDPLPVPDRYDSQALQLNVGLVDNMPDNPPDLATLEAALDAHRVALGGSVFFRAALDAWPLYPKDALHGVYAEPAVPVLMIQGELDFIPLSYAETAAAALETSDFEFISIPFAPHGASFQSPVSPAGNCGAQLLAQFFVEPSPHLLDVSCLSKLQPLSFAVPAGLSDFLFGTQDAYEGDPGPVSAQNLVQVATVSASPEIEQLRARLRRRLPM